MKKFIQKILGRFGYRITKLGGYAETDPFFQSLQKLNLHPKCIVDIGANCGNWTLTAMRYFPEAKYILLEPQGDLLRESGLDKFSNVRIFEVGAGAETTTAKLTIAPRSDSFSFSLSPDEAEKLGRKQIEFPVVALDDLIEKENLDAPNIVKIDAEGWDLRVLEGAQKAINSADVVLMEAAVMNKTFKNRIDVVIEKMAQLGFSVFDITDLNRTRRYNALWLVEIAFVKCGGTLDLEAASFE